MERWEKVNQKISSAKNYSTADLLINFPGFLILVKVLLFQLWFHHPK